MNTQTLAVPVSIILAGVLIAGAVMVKGGQSSATAPIAQVPDVAQPAPTTATEAVAPITAQDHIKGDPNAPVKIVEYSDFECPFCKRFHVTMNQIMDEYGVDGKVAWVYRQFPLEQLHPVKAMQEAMTSECVAELGGNDAFWKFTDRFFELTPSNNQTDLTTVIPQIISEIGLSQTAVDTCVASDTYRSHIQDDIRNAIDTGGTGTPWSIVIGPNGETFPLSGAQPYAAVKQLIDLALSAQ